MADSNQWIVANLRLASGFTTRWELLAFSMDRSPREGDIMEFGVAAGNSIRFIRQHATASGRRCQIIGYDSFFGLPEPWPDVGGIVQPGHFSTDGQPPSIEGVRFVTGLYCDTLSASNYAGEIAFVHIDCDLYSSTKEALAFIRPYLIFTHTLFWSLFSFSHSCM